LKDNKGSFTQPSINWLHKALPKITYMGISYSSNF